MTRLKEITAKIRGHERTIEENASAIETLSQEIRHSVMHLPEQQHQVLRLKHLSDKEIAAKLGIGLNAVKHHMAQLLEKFGIHSRRDLP